MRPLDPNASYIEKAHWYAANGPRGKQRGRLVLHYLKLYLKEVNREDRK